MKETKIIAPEGYEIDKENSTFEVIKFKEVTKEVNQSAREWLEKVWMENKIKSFISFDNCWTFGESIDQWMFQQDWKNGNLYYSYHRVFTVLLERFNVGSGAIDSLVKDVVGRDINCEGLTPFPKYFVTH